MTKARIIYVTGMKPKPDPVLHRAELVRVLAASLARAKPEASVWLAARPENFVLVSWTSLLYSECSDIALDRDGIDRLLQHPTPAAGDKREADALGLKLRRAWHLVGDSFPWLSNLVAPASLKVTLADVYRYLQNRDGIAERIRQLLIDQLDLAFAAGDQVLLIGHSLGSVIAYDSLWHMSREAGRNDRVALLTLGSPLATRFIRLGLQGATQAGVMRYPDNIDRWVNVAARGEMVALHRRIKPFFAAMQRLGLIREIKDEPAIYNHYRGDTGLNVHKSYGYLNHAVVASQISRWLDYSI